MKIEGMGNGNFCEALSGFLKVLRFRIFFRMRNERLKPSHPSRDENHHQRHENTFVAETFRLINLSAFEALLLLRLRSRNSSSD